MSEKCYFISEASKLVGVEAHVLRYWEEQLELPIKRNEMGHRYYVDEDIHLMQSIRQIMEKGIQLRAVKMMLPGLMEHREDTFLELMGSGSQQERTASGIAAAISETAAAVSETDEAENLRTEEKERKDELMTGSQTEADHSHEMRMAQFQEIMSNLIGQALQKNNSELAAATGDQVTERVIKEMDYLMRVRESQEEERYKKLDETIRSLQKNRTERHFWKGKRSKPNG